MGEFYIEHAVGDRNLFIIGIESADRRFIGLQFPGSLDEDIERALSGFRVKRLNEI